MSVREALLDAARDAAVAGLWATTRMADVAAAAGVSRQTLYNEFGSKEALAEALTRREADRFLAGTAEACRNSPGDAGDCVRASTVWALTEARQNLLVKAALTDEAAGLLPTLTTRSAGLLVLFRDAAAAVILERWPHLDSDEVAWVAELAVRLTVSHLVVPTEAVEVTADHIALMVRRLLAPAA
ncbi:TetR/AcrR family transcriptional regulator [Yinghuangia soli]|uniref:TetR family transcriptional regulator n=1 Tax=Yinghuangia soli TaxID=2908204 RepID=A0AA41U1T2_9ACTN|nr:TetR family transcriptional regulator [Yinghuangia soli]MCF2529920.1 TetR family transcriptional regulator [Yinghuangia soli]